jgi:two-component system OmpR family sensor kinase
MSIRLRLTLLYSSILGVALVVFALFVYALLQRNLTIQIDSTLRTSGNAMARFLGPRTDSDPDRPDGRAGAARIVALRDGSLPSPSPDTYIQVVGGSGDVIARSGNLASSDLTLPTPTDGLRSPRFQVVGVGDQQMRLLTQPVQFQTQIGAAPGGGFVEVAHSLNDVDATLAHLRFILGLGVAGAMLVAVGAGWVLSTTALRPIARLTEAAHEIGEAQDFSRRVPYIGPRDEVGSLAGTFNGMLERLEAAYASISRSLEGQRRFVADASHELRTPLTTIRGNVELLSLDDSGESVERREALEDIASEAERMSRLVTNLLALARADAGVHIEREPIAVRPLVEEVFRQFRRAGPEVQFELGDVPNVSVSASSDHLKQLLLILLDNARKYSPAGGLVRLSAQQSNGWLRLIVSDEGPGIPEEDQERIFDRFYRIDPSRQGGGAGLGLSIARWIAMEHQGSLTVQSKPGQGSSFILSLPLAVDVPAAEPDMPEKVAATA